MLGRPGRPITIRITIQMHASNSQSYTHLILALGIVREPTIRVFITSEYPGTHDMGLPTSIPAAGYTSPSVVCSGMRVRPGTVLM